MKKAFPSLGVILIGSIVMIAIDNLVGASFKEDVSSFAKITHNVAHMLWGVALLATVLKSRRLL